MRSIVWGIVLGAMAYVLYTGTTMQEFGVEPVRDDLTLPAPDTSIADKLTGYDTIEEAGVHAIERAYKCSHYYECGGVIGRRTSDNKYVVGPVRSDYAGDHVEIVDGTPNGVDPVASYHTHPCLSDSHFPAIFSPADLEGAVQDHQIAFMGDLCTGDVHEFDPMTMRPDDTALQVGLGHVIYVSGGKIVGKIPVDGKSVEPVGGMIK